MNRGLGLAFLGAQHAEQVQGVGLDGDERQDLLVAVAGGVRPAGLVMAEALHEKVLDARLQAGLRLELRLQLRVGLRLRLRLELRRRLGLGRRLQQLRLGSRVRRGRLLRPGRVPAPLSLA
jgi:hypothetical protein